MKITYQKKSKFYRSNLILDNKKPWMDGTWQDGYYHGVAVVQAGVEDSKRHKIIFLHATNNNFDYQRNIDFSEEKKKNAAFYPSEHQIKLLCAKFAKDVINEKIK